MAVRQRYDNATELNATYLKHGKEQVLFSAFVLVSVNGEHDRLKK